MYYIVFGLLYVISLLPFPVLYLLSDILYFFLYFVAGYRRKVVMNNLLLAFPEKTNEERKAIARKFYRRFTDNWIESLKLLSISEKQLGKHITTDLEALHTVYATGRNVHFLMGHQFNWEWANSVIPPRTPYKTLVAYSPISSKIVDRMFLYQRQRFGATMLPYNEMGKAMLPYRRTQYLLALVADQNPHNPRKSYWLNFMGQPTAFVQGPEKGARLGNIPVVYLSFSRPRRGYYHMQTSLVEMNPGNSAEGELTRKYVALLEENIRRYPELYLWSHKRWKHNWSEAYEKLWIDTGKPPLLR
ncbi:MAG TPA: lysophospholipid acyltransferase family protein [Chitinophagaceae bacterium]|nr:lysophospholipid acyltransferase family protein [Chitinophagaceae bacterium]